MSFVNKVEGEEENHFSNAHIGMIVVRYIDIYANALCARYDARAASIIFFYKYEQNKCDIWILRAFLLKISFKAGPPLCSSN